MSTPTPPHATHPLDFIQELLATIWRHDKELVRLQEEMKRTVDERTLEMREQLSVLRGRLERIQANAVKTIGTE